jgi:cytochrome c oxidase assembly protein Cox11
VNDLSTKNIKDVTLSYTFFSSDYYEPTKNW